MPLILFLVSFPEAVFILGNPMNVEEYLFPE
jgi:hypothetical protein